MTSGFRLELVRMFVVITALTAATATASTTVLFGLSSASLLSGSLTSCLGAAVNTSGCTGGLASVSLVQRRIAASTGVTPFVMPTLDRQTAFVQMHPLTWAVNIPILNHFGYSAPTVPPSIFTSNFKPGWEYFHNTSTKMFFSNALIAPYDEWYSSYIPNVVLDGVVGILYVDSDNAPNTVSPFATIDAMLKTFALRSTASVSVVVFTDSLYSPQTVYDSIGSLKPDVIIAYSSSNAAQYMIGNTIILRVALTAALLHVFNVTYDTTTKVLVNATFQTSSLAIAPGTGDSQYYADQAYLSTFAQEAGQNDPVLGSSNAMPVHRVGTMRLCFGGECPAGRLYAESMRFVHDTDIAFTSSGAFRGNGWPSGSFKISDVWALNPFANPVCYGTIRGITIWDIFNYSTYLSTAPSTEVSGFGDRLLQIAGMRVTFVPNVTASTRLVSISILDRATNAYKPLDRLKLYTYAADSFVSQVFAPYPSLLGARYAGEVAPTCLTNSIMQTEVTTFMANLSTFNTTYQGSFVLASASVAANPANLYNLAQSQATCSPGTKWVASVGSCVDCPSGETSTPGATTCAAIEKSNVGTIIAIAVPIGAVVLILMIAKTVHSEVERRKNVRNVDNAPKGGEVTLLFTDIQDSTKLWGTCPASMSVSLDHHHRLIRECISRHNGYEVKTVGDCFMIAVGTVDAAVSLAVDIQHALQNQQFPKAICRVYQCETEEQLDEIDDNPEDLQELDPLFNGLRVRIGMHTGTPDVVFDEVTKGYDYYGPPVNVAARVESTAKGGQINASRDVVNRLGERKDVEVMFFAAVELKGVAGLTEILHIVPVTLRGRVAVYQAMIKTQGEGDSEPESNTGSDTASMASGVPVAQDTELTKRFTVCLMAALKVLKPKDAKSMLDDLCKAWRVRAPKKDLPIEEHIKLIAPRATKGMKRTDPAFSNSFRNLGGTFRSSMRRPSAAGAQPTSAAFSIPDAAGANSTNQDPRFSSTTETPLS